MIPLVSFETVGQPTLSNPLSVPVEKLYAWVVIDKEGGLEGIAAFEDTNQGRVVMCCHDLSVVMSMSDIARSIAEDIPGLAMSLCAFQVRTDLETIGPFPAATQ